jgi:PhzF family phenazine biosynthesis protein
MTNLRLFQVDAFAQDIFSGNPAAVVPLEAFLPDTVMQKIAAENNLAETAFFVARPDLHTDNVPGQHYDLRWFTPNVEIEFCGHATIASAHVLIAELGVESPIVFHTQIGALTVSLSEGGYSLRAPRYAMTPVVIDDELRRVFGPSMMAAYLAVNNLYIEYEKAEMVSGYVLNSADIRAILLDLMKARGGKTPFGVSIMAPGTGALSEYDFVSRHFAPLHGVDEDPVTGSAHSALGPFWGERLAKTNMQACQCSARRGELQIVIHEDSVDITGPAITYLRGSIDLP